MERNTKQRVWKNTFRLILPHKKQFIWVVFLSLLSTGASLVEPLIYREAINDVAGLFVKQAKDETRKELGATQSVKRKKQPHTKGHVAGRSPEEALETLLWAVAALFLINLAATILWLVGENKNVRLSCLIEQRFIQGTFAHVLNMPLSFFSKRSSAALSKQIDQSEEVSAIVNGFSQQILPELISLLGILVIMFWQNLALTSIALVTIPFYLWIAWRSANKLESGLSKYYERWEEVSSRIQDALAGVKTVKLSGAEDREVSNLRRVADQGYADYIARSRLANKYVFWETMLSHLSTALVLGYGGWLTLENKLTPGDVVMFVAYLDRLYGPIDSLASLWVGLQQNIASIARAFKLLDYPEEDQSGKPLLLPRGRIEFRNVHFGYTSEREVLKGISFTLEPGQATALVGSSGAGKTTTVDLLLKLYKPSSGEILVDGQNLSELDSSSVRGQIGMVAADGALFHGTLADNIRYKRPEAGDAEVLKAALAAGMEHTLQRLPAGLQTLVGESGMGLSVGEKQRVHIARILVAGPRILILDEATANLDYATEAEVKKTIEDIRRQNTIVIIAHRYSMVRDADQVIVLSDGAVLEQGSPAELLAKGGWFADFANAADEDPREEPGEEEEASPENFEDEEDP